MNRMSGRRAQDYGAGTKWFHWLTAALMTTQFLIGWIMPDIKRGMQPENLMNLHMSVGMLILAVGALRLFWRLAVGSPEPSMPAWQNAAAEALHALLYLLLFAMIFTGWSYASMRGWSITVFGALPMPDLFAQGSALGRIFGIYHETLSWVLLGAIGLHVAAALAHYFLLRDRVLQRMLPRVGAAE